MSEEDCARLLDPPPALLLTPTDVEPAVEVLLPVVELLAAWLVAVALLDCATLLLDVRLLEPPEVLTPEDAREEDVRLLLPTLPEEEELAGVPEDEELVSSPSVRPVQPARTARASTPARTTPTPFLRCSM